MFCISTSLSVVCPACCVVPGSKVPAALRVALSLTGRYQRECRGKTQAHPTAPKHSAKPPLSCCSSYRSTGQFKDTVPLFKNQKPGHVLTLGAMGAGGGGGIFEPSCNGKKKRQSNVLMPYNETKRVKKIYHSNLWRTHQTNTNTYRLFMLLTVHLGIIPFNDQLNAQLFFVYVYFSSLHVSSIQVLIIRRFSCINTISGICRSM